MFKGKLLFLYYPHKFAPIYSKRHLQHFVSELNLPGTFDSEVAMQKALMEYRASWRELMTQPIYLYMRLLYDVFGYPPDHAAVATSTGSYPVLSDAIQRAAFIDDMPHVVTEMD